MTEETLEFKLTDSWKKVLDEGKQFFFVPEFATDSNGEKYMRPQGRKTIYKIVKEDHQGNQEYVCNTCNSEIMGKKVTRPIWDGLFECSGSGRTISGIVPYCPICEP